MMSRSLTSFSGTYSAALAVAGWEQRSLHSIQSLVRSGKTSRLLIFYSHEMASLTYENREKIRSTALDYNVELSECEFTYSDYLGSWRSVLEACRNFLSSKDTYLVDITTAPRNIMWYIFEILNGIDCKIHYIYWSPKSYNSEWLCRDPGRPRLLLHRGGITEYGKSTMLLISTGFDYSRIDQLLSTFDPARVVLLVQTGAQFDNEKQNINKVSQLSMGNKIEITQVDIDFYDGTKWIIAQNIVDEYSNSYNIVLSSLGPKPSAACFFDISLKDERLALCYTPTNQVNPDYSSGVGAMYIGEIGSGKEFGEARQLGAE